MMSNVPMETPAAHWMVTSFSIFASAALPEREARGLLTEAFIAEAFETAREDIREILRAQASAWLVGDQGATGSIRSGRTERIYHVMTERSDFDTDAIRTQFPILAREVHGKPLVYLDNAASAQKSEAVIEAMAGQMRTAYANVHRGLHTLANETTQAFEDAREDVRRFLNAGSARRSSSPRARPKRSIWSPADLPARFEPGDEIVLSIMEHHSNIVPWHFLRERHGAVLKWVGLNR